MGLDQRQTAAEPGRRRYFSFADYAADPVPDEPPLTLGTARRHVEAEEAPPMQPPAEDEPLVLGTAMRRTPEPEPEPETQVEEELTPAEEPVEEPVAFKPPVRRMPETMVSASGAAAASALEVEPAMEAPPEPAPPPLKLVTPPVRRVAAAPDEFVFANGGTDASAYGVKAKRPALSLRVNRRLVGLLLVVAVAAVGVFVMRSAGTQAESPAPEQAAQPAAAPRPVSVPLSVEGSQVTFSSAGGAFSANVAIRNPNEFVASQVSVQIMVKDGAGRVLTTQTRSLEVLSPGTTVVIEVTGEIDPRVRAPLAVFATASALSLAS